jgi:hypothetical protein
MVSFLVNEGDCQYITKRRELDKQAKDGGVTRRTKTDNWDPANL